MKQLRFLLCFLFAFYLVDAYGQGYSNKGKDFYITYPIHIDGSLSVMGLYITSDQDAQGTITVGSKTLSFSVTANNVTRKFIGGTNCTSCDASSSGVYLSQDEGITAGGAIHVVSDNPVVVYAHIIRTSRSGATLALPTNVWGKQYIAPSYKNVGSQGNSAYGYGTITVVAAESNTTVRITPSVNSKNLLHPAGVSYDITLVNPGDVYQVQFAQNADISGTTVQSISSGAGTGSCKKIGVFSSTSWSAFGCNNGSSGDNLYQQLFPTSAWGKNFLTAPAKTRTSDIFRVFVSDPATVVKKTENGTTTTLAGLINNAYYEYTTGNPTYIETDKPSSVVQYMTTQSCQAGATIGDPEMILLNPVEQTINNITVFSAHKNFVPPGQSAISNCYLNIIIKSNATGSFKINGKAPTGLFIPIPGTSYSYLQEDVTSISQTNPVQTLAADSSFSALAYGFGSVESYGYNAGTNVKDFTQVASFQNPYQRIDSAVTCVNTPVQFGIPLNFQPTTIKWDFSSAPNISPNTIVGPSNSPAYDSVRSFNGQTLYYYGTHQYYTFASGNTAALRDTIKLYTTSSTPDGCGSTDQVYSIPVTVNSKPTVSAFTLVFNGCIADSVRLTDQTPNTDGSIKQWVWDFNDGTPAVATTSTSIVKLFSSTGSYTIKLKTANDIGCASDSVTQVVNITAKPIAQFTVPTITCTGSDITFTDASTIASGSIAKWTWDLANGAGPVTLTTNTAQTTKYDSFGVKDVKLMVESSSGCKSDTFRISPAFTVNPLPKVGFIIPEICVTDGTATFTDTTSIADGSTFTWNWRIAAGKNTGVQPTFVSASAQNAKALVSKADLYMTTLKVTSSKGCIDSLTQQLTVNGPTPKANFTVQNANGLCSNDSIRIVNTSTVDFGYLTRLDIYWDVIYAPAVKVPDENPVDQKSYATAYPNFQSPASKTYSVKLTAFSGNSSACQNSVTKIVTVNAAPKVSFSTMPGICNEASPRQITQASYDTRVTGSFVYSGTGVSSTGLYTPQPLAPGTYPIRYTYTSDKGCVDTITKNITVWPSPVAKWGVSSPLCQKNDIPFTDSSVANYSTITQRIWNYDDGTAAVTRTDNAVYTRQFANAKTYNISLKVITDSGCSSTVNTQAVNIHYLPKPAFTLPSICLPDGKGQFTNQSTIGDGSEALFSYLWNFNDPNDVSASTLKEPVHRYSALGPYPVQLKITSKDGCVDSLTQQLTTIYPQPKADFSMSSPTACVGDTIGFKDMGNGITSNPVSWVWNLANGNSSTLQNPSKKFLDSGTFTISYYFLNGQGCVSDTASKPVTVYPYPVLQLGPNLKVLEGGVITIKTKFVYGSGLQYQWLPSTYLNSDTAAAPKSSPADDITYKLILTGSGGCSVSDTIFIQVLRSPEVPNAFSPNGDGFNDTWRIKYLESYPGAVIDVYNRYGQIVFHSIGYDQDWDGNYNGKPMPVGTYYYIINPKNGRQILTGSVTIIR
jgi:gliding motility-associated-like protein